MADKKNDAPAAPVKEEAVLVEVAPEADDTGPVPPNDEDADADEELEAEPESPYKAAIYVKRPILVPAMQWDNSLESARAIEAWTEGKVAYNTNTEVMRIDTPEGSVEVPKNGWVAQDARGQFYPIGSVVFSESYILAETPVEDEPVEG